MIPKISVKPLATRKSSRPYWTALRHWTRKVARSSALPQCPGPAAASGIATLSRGRSELAAARRVGERFHGDGAELVVVALDLAQVDILHRVAGGRERELAARAVDHGLVHGRGELVALREIAVHRLQAVAEDLR